jgi:Flp pilus assembly pilin Flp
MERSAHPAKRGQGLVEYALIILFVAIAIIASLTLFGQSLRGYYGTISTVF